MVHSKIWKFFDWKCHHNDQFPRRSLIQSEIRKKISKVWRTVYGMKSDNEHKFDTLRLSPNVNRFLFSISRWSKYNSARLRFYNLIHDFLVFLVEIRIENSFYFGMEICLKREKSFESIWMQMDSLGIIIIKPWKASLAHPDQTLNIISELNLAVFH